jgi:hypothetical protein
MSALERFQRCYQMSATGCWEWTKRLNPGGYGSFRANGRRAGAHRWSYELHVGPIPAGMDIDHLCRNRKCVNPHHLEPVTRSENLRRGEVGQWNRTTERCPQGHPYDQSNTFHDKRGWRGCRVCRREASRRYQARKRNAA